MAANGRNSARRVALAAATMMVMGGAAAAAMAAPSTTARPRGAAAHQVRYETLEQSQYGEYLQPVVLVANSPEAWNKAMAKLDSRQALVASPARAARDLGVDWSRYSVLLVAMGQYPDARCRMAVRRVWNARGDLLVDVDVQMASGGSQTMTSPYELVLLPKRNWRSASLSQPEGAMSDMRSAGNGAGASPLPVTSQVRVTWADVKDTYR